MSTSVDSDEIDLQPSDLNPTAISGSGDPGGGRTAAPPSARRGLDGVSPNGHSGALKIVRKGLGARARCGGVNGGVAVGDRAAAAAGGAPASME